MKEFGRKEVWESFEQTLGENEYVEFREGVFTNSSFVSSVQHSR